MSVFIKCFIKMLPSVAWKKKKISVWNFITDLVIDSNCPCINNRDIINKSLHLVTRITVFHFKDWRLLLAAYVSEYGRQQ